MSPAELIESLSKAADIGDTKEFFGEMHKAGGVIRQQLLSEGKYPRSFVHRVSEFLLKWLETKDNIAYTHVLGRYVTRMGAPSAKLEVVALDPAEITEPVFSSVYCSVNMSGTLQPLEAYVKVTKLPDSTICEAVPSPFPEEHILSLACLGVTTAMEQHTPEMYKKLVRRLAEVVHNTPANVGIFTASYEVLEKLREAGIEDYFEKPLLHEHRGMKSRENERQPGGQARGKSIGIDAVKQYQVLLSPFDVRYGNFAGALINAVTKNGTNDLSGSAYVFYRDQSMTRSQPYLSDFEQQQYGFTLGGPIIKDKAHFFVNAELQDQTAPASGPYVGLAGTTNFPAQATIDSYNTILGNYGLPASTGGSPCSSAPRPKSYRPSGRPK